MSTEAQRRRATSLAGSLTDPTLKKNSFYHLMKLKASRYGKEVGVDIVLKKSTMLPWVEEYLYSVFKKELTLIEEKELTRKNVIIDYILENCLPVFALNLIDARSKSRDGLDSTKFRRNFCFMGKFPKRGGGGES